MIRDEDSLIDRLEMFDDTEQLVSRANEVADELKFSDRYWIRETLCNLQGLHALCHELASALMLRHANEFIDSHKPESVESEVSRADLSAT